MRDDVREALDSASSGSVRQTGMYAPPKRISVEGLQRLLRTVLRDLPEEMTVQELREELET